VWSDQLFVAEQRQLVATLGWGLVSLVAGMIVLAVARGRGSRSPLLTHFGVQMATWGSAIALVAFGQYRALGLRDLASATRLDRFAWFAAGLEVGIILVGMVITLMSWRPAPKLGGVGAGLAISTQGLALLILNLHLITAVVR
jgi:hypothetical protein